MKTVLPIRKSLGLAQAAMADLLDVAQSTVSAYERGVVEISPDVAKRLVALCASKSRPVTLDQIYGLAELPGAEREELATQS